MRLTLRQLQIFCAIAQHGSTTGAGLAVALSQSATSAALNDLEHALDTQLFDRVGKRLVLNDVGAALLPQARKLLDGAHAIEAGFTPGAAALAGRLKIGCSTTIGNYVLPLVLRALHTQAPELRVDMDSANSSRIAGKVANFELDMGLIEGPCHLPELHAEPWLVDELVVVVGRRHALAKRPKVTPAQLRDADWLLREPGSGTREEVEQALLRHLHTLSDTRQIGSSEAIKNMLVQGLGVSCLSRWVVDGLIASKKLQPLNSGLPRLTRRFFLIWHRDKFFSPNLQRFRDACRQFKQARQAPAGR
ncbi:LysR family transcriptional regulator [Xanthomonas campestris pv. badrii]|uniref:LysR family transcriptional regulator n=1 Tax=Xanthomonas campestris pv. badrii TaxID=149696 RepID=A0A7Z2VC26_XANCA|nr:LysR family transcriptional regulator [Xanthomonas campestris]MCC4603786.1 LysR family transcriptional regulator [Xanthomonas campestris pv. parthenii]QJD68845.1 LysR family transcriptional regulator [Xanthomonas campestris pv. badrii]